MMGCTAGMDFWTGPAGSTILAAGRQLLMEAGMGSSSPTTNLRIQNVEISDDTLTVDLSDGRRLAVPLAWFPRLLHATEEQRRNWELLGDGQGIHWPEIDEDLSVAGLLRGTRAPEAPAV
jgi:hypothetical protein